MVWRLRRDPWKPSTPYLYWSKRDWDTLEVAYQNYFISGATGVSKTTGPGAALRMASLNKKQRFGGLILTCKGTDVERAEKELSASRTVA